MSRASWDKTPEGCERQIAASVSSVSSRLLGLILPSLSGGMQILVISSLLAASESIHPSTPSSSSSTFLQPEKPTRLMPATEDQVEKRGSNDNDDKRHSGLFFLLFQWQWNAAHLWNSWEKCRALVFDVIIAGWGVVVSPSRLKWKIAMHTLANTSAVSRVQPTHTHLLIPPPPYPCVSGCARSRFGKGTPVSSPNPSVWFLFQLSLVWRLVVLRAGSGLFFYPPA